MIVSRVYAMARPARPAVEGELVRAALANQPGTAARRARSLAATVARQALAAIDGDPADRALLLLDALVCSPAARLALDEAIDTAALVRAERARRAEARGWRRLSDAQGCAEDREIVAAVTAALTKRYSRHLARFQP